MGAHEIRARVLLILPSCRQPSDLTLRAGPAANLADQVPLILA